jgi:hypothetical protein
VNAKETWVFPGVATSDVGALAVVEGVAETFEVTVPVPAELTAETLK